MLERRNRLCSIGACGFGNWGRKQWRELGWGVGISPLIPPRMCSRYRNDGFTSSSSSLYRGMAIVRSILLLQCYVLKIGLHITQQLSTRYHGWIGLIRWFNWFLFFNYLYESMSHDVPAPDMYVAKLGDGIENSEKKKKKSTNK